MLETGNGEITTFVVTTKENPQFTIMHRRFDNGSGSKSSQQSQQPLLKYHVHDYEAYYVVCGKIRFIAGNENEYTAQATSGTLVVIPPYVSHGYSCLSSDNNTIMLIINYPSGPCEQFTRDYSSLRSTSMSVSSSSSPSPATTTTRTAMTTSSKSTSQQKQPPPWRGGVIPSLQDRKNFRTKYGIYINETYNTTTTKKNKEKGVKNPQNDSKQQKPIMKDLNKDGPLSFGGLVFSHGVIDKDGEESSWSYAYNTNNKRPHSVSQAEVRSSNDNDMVLFCIRHA